MSNSNNSNSKKLVEYYETNDPRQTDIESELLASPEGSEYIETDKGNYVVQSTGWSLPSVNKIENQK